MAVATRRGIPGLGAGAPAPPWVGPAAAVAAVQAALLAGLLAGHLDLLLALALGVPLLVALAARPQRGLLALAALLPFDGLLLLVPHPPVVDGWKEGLVALTLLATLVAPPAARARRRAGTPLPRWVGPLLVLAALAAGSAALAAGPAAALGLKIVLFPVLVAVAAWRCPLDRLDRDRLVSVLMATGAVTAVVGLAQQVAGPGAMAELGYEYNSVIRFAGEFMRSWSTFAEPFPFAFFLVVVLLVGGTVALGDRQRARNRWFLAATPLLLAALAVTVVRAAWIGLAAGLAVVVWRRHRGLLHALPLAALALALAVFVAGGTGSSALSSESLEERRAGWRTNLGVAARAPLGLGVGATGVAAAEGEAARGSSPLRALLGGGPADGEDDASDPAAFTTGAIRPGVAYQSDNYYVKTFLELGVLGLWAFVFLLVVAFRSSLDAGRRSVGPDGALAVGVAASVVAAAVASGFSAYFEIFPMDLYFWLLLGVVSASAPAAAATAAAGARPAR